MLPRSYSAEGSVVHQDHCASFWSKDSALPVTSLEVLLFLMALLAVNTVSWSVCINLWWQLEQLVSLMTCSCLFCPWARAEHYWEGSANSIHTSISITGSWKGPISCAEFFCFPRFNTKLNPSGDSMLVWPHFKEGIILIGFIITVFIF